MRLNFIFKNKREKDGTTKAFKELNRGQWFANAGKLMRKEKGLGSWCYRQRLVYHSGERMKRFNKLKIDWLLLADENFFEPRQKSFTERLNEYKEFLEINEREPTRREMEWVGTIKQKFKKGELLQEEFDSILNVNVNFFLKKKKTFEDNLVEYKEFIDVNHREPKTRELRWVGRVKKSFKDGKLTEEQIDLIHQVNPNFFDLETLKGLIKYTQSLK